MEFVRAERTKAMADAHADPRVTTIADRIGAVPIRQMTQLLKRSLYSPLPYSRGAVLTIVGQLPMQPSSSLALANDLADAAVSIANEADIDKRHRLRAAALEATVAALLRQRPADVLEEHRACGLDRRIYSPDGCSHPLDVIAEVAPIEIYECKCSAAHRSSDGTTEWEFNQADVTLFERIAEASAEDGRDVLCAIATFLSEAEVRLVLKGLTIGRPLFIVTIENLEQLAKQPPTVHAA